MRKVLLVDTNVSSYPIYQYLIQSGYEVYVTGSNPNDFLAKCSNNYIELDYSKTTALRALIDKLEIDYLIPGCNDMSYKSCAAINHNDQFPGIETPINNEILNNKKSYRHFANINDLPVPQTYSIENYEEIRFPVIVKPTDSFSGQGITILHRKNPDELDSAIKAAMRSSKAGTYVIEEFVVGQLHSHSAFISMGSIVMDVIVEEHCTANPFAVDTSRVLSDFPESVLKKIRGAAINTAETLNLKDGLLHTQFISNGEKIWLIEPTRRCPGDLYSRLIEMSTGLNYAENYTRPFLGLKYNFSSDTSVKSLVMRHTITNRSGTNFWTLKIKEPTNIIEYISLTTSGDYIKPAPIGRIGILFTKNDNSLEFNKTYQSTIDRNLYTTN